MPTLTTYRRDVSRLAGTYEQGVSTSAGEVSRMICTNHPFITTVTDDASWVDKWLYRPSSSSSSDRQRLIASMSTSSGYFVPDKAWGQEAGNAETFEVSGAPLSPLDIIQCVNEGLERCWVVVEFTFTVASNLTRMHSLAATTWLTEPRNVFQVGVLPTGQTRTEYDPFTRGARRGVATKINGIVYLEGPTFNTTDTVYVKALKRAYDHCKVSAGTFGGQSGLALESDEAPVQSEWLAQAALLKMYDRLDPTVGVSERADLDRMRAMAVQRFSRLTNAYLEVPERTFVPMVYMGSSLSGRRW